MSDLHLDYNLLLRLQSKAVTTPDYAPMLGKTLAPSTDQTMASVEHTYVVAAGLQHLSESEVVALRHRFRV